MGNFATKGSKFIYEDQGREETLLDLDDFFFNKGRVPFHSDLTEVTVPNLIVDNMDRHSEFCKGNGIQESLLIYYTILDILFVREHVRSKYPKVIVEIGNGSDVMMEHITEILGKLHPESSYTRVTQDNDPGTNIADIVLINASEDTYGLEDFVQKSMEIVKDDGCVIMFDKGNPELCSAYCTHYPDYHKYTLIDGVDLLINKGL